MLVCLETNAVARSELC